MINTKTWTCIVLLLLPAALAASKPRPQTSSQDTVRDQIVAQERAGLDALKRGDLAAFNASLADEAVFVDPHGPATKAEVIDHTSAFKLDNFAMADVKFVPLPSDSGLIVYTLTESGTSHGRQFSAKVYVSSLWLKRGGKWLCAFSQETAPR